MCTGQVRTAAELPHTAMEQSSCRRTGTEHVAFGIASGLGPNENKKANCINHTTAINDMAFNSPNNDVFTFFKRAMLALTSLTLKQLASGVVVRENLPIKDLPNPLKREMEALAMLPGDYTIIGESKVLGKCGGGNLTRDEVVWANRFFEKGKKISALMGDVGQRIKVTVGSAGTETGSGAEKLKRFVVKRRGEAEEGKAENVFYLKKKAIEEGKKGGRIQSFVNNDSFNCEYHVPSSAGKPEEGLKLSMFINQKRELVMLYTFQKKGFEWSTKTIAQRD